MAPMDHPAHAPRSPFDDARMVAILAAEGEAARGLTGQAIERTCTALGWTDRARVRRIADLGSGPGVDACALAAAFPAATVAAVDGSPTMRAAAAHRADAAGLAARVEATEGELDGGITALGPLDLAWAALSLHHARDVTATLERVAAQLRGGGGLSVLERHTPLRLRPADELGRPGIWDRVDAAQSSWYRRVRASRHDHGDLDRVAGQVAAAGLEIAHSDTLEDTTNLPAGAPRELLVTRHVQMALRDLGDALEPADVAALEAPGTPTRLAGSAVTATSTRLFVVARAGARGSGGQGRSISSMR